MKRLSKNRTKLPEAKKNLDFDSNPSGEISQESPCPVNACVSAFTKLPPVVGAISPIAPTCSSGELLGIVGRPMSSSTSKKPLKITKTKVYLSVEYPSKTVRKELKDDLAVLGKAIASGFKQRIAKAILKNIKTQEHCRGKS